MGSKNDRNLSERYRVKDADDFRLKDFDPGDTGKIGPLADGVAERLLAESIERISHQQERLYADDSRALLLVFQAMDAAGKDGTIKHVLSGVNPQGCQVTAFKAPSSEELDHDFLWRTTRALPERGRIGIFNRSYYEEVLVVRVHPELLAKQRLPREHGGKDIWKHRFEDINAYERQLTRSGTTILKFFLYVSKKEQRRRFLERLDDHDKAWKFSPADVAERELWSEYMDAYEDMIRATSTKHAPWFVVPADNKWFTRLVVSDAIDATLDSLDLQFPKVDAARIAELERCRKLLGD